MSKAKSKSKLMIWDNAKVGSRWMGSNALAVAEGWMTMGGRDECYRVAGSPSYRTPSGAYRKLFWVTVAGVVASEGSINNTSMVVKPSLEHELDLRNALHRQFLRDNGRRGLHTGHQRS